MALLDGFPDLANLDNKTFDDLVNEARTLLIRYSKEWTDHNISDPGITFIELFAWLAEMQIYQLNRVTDANYLKFLKLMGFDLFDAIPASVDITFKKKADALSTENGNKIIKAGTQVITELDTEKIVYELSEDLTLIEGDIRSIITAYDSQTIDNTRANETDGIFFAAFGEKPDKGACLRLGFDTTFPNKEIKITFFLYEDDLPPLRLHDKTEPPFILNSILLVWEYWGNGKWNDLPIKKDSTMDLTRSGRIVFDWPSDIIQQDDRLYWTRCILKQGIYEIAPHINTILLNTIPAVQVETIIKKKDGTGIPGQVLQLEKTPHTNSIRFSIAEVLDWCSLLKKFREKAGSAEDSPEKHILNQFDRKTRSLINEWEDDNEPTDVQKYLIIDSLNKTLNSRHLYDFTSWKRQNLSGLPNKFLWYFFNWAEIPENEYYNFRLIDFLGKNFDMDWINKRDVVVQKTSEKTIEISDGSNHISLELNNNNTKVILKISDNRIAEFIARAENSKLNIYYLRKTLQFSSDNELQTLNRFLIEASFPNIITKHRLIIQVEKNRECEYWYEVEDFTFSGPDDTHYTFNQENNEIIFGNGLNGLIPTDNQEIKASYRTTLGSRGNISKGQKFRINENEPGIFSGINLRASSGGKDHEILDIAKLRARKDSRKIYRAITSEDYEYLACHTPGIRVARAKAISGYHQEFPLIKMPGTVTVIAVPHMREGNINPVAGDVFLQTILQHLNVHRLITTNVYVINPEYMEISIYCVIHVKKGNSPERIKTDVTKKLDRFLDPLRGGADGKGWPFGRSVYPSEIHQLIKKVDGVDYVTDVSFIDEKGNYNKDIMKISPISLVYPEEHHLKIKER